MTSRGPTTETERQLTRLESELRRLEIEYNMFFSGRLVKPPWDTRSRVAALIKRLDQSHIQNYGDRFRFSTIQSRFTAFVNLWDRGLRAREEGRPGPFPLKKSETTTAPAAAKNLEDRVVHVAAFRDPAEEADKLRGLYDSLAEARREAGEEAVPFDRFADLVRDQVGRIKAKGGSEVAFRVAVKDGKVHLTARAMKSGNVTGKEED